MIRSFFNRAWVLETPGTTYAMRLLETGQIEHLYYGRRIPVERIEDLDALCEQHEFPPGTSCTYDPEHGKYSLDDMRLEMSSLGKGDFREPFVEIIYPDGSATSDFVFAGADISEGKPPFETLPGSYGDKVDHLCLLMREKETGLLLELHYYVYEDCDVITRSSRLVNPAREAPAAKARAAEGVGAEEGPGPSPDTVPGGAESTDAEEGLGPSPDTVPSEAEGMDAGAGGSCLKPSSENAVRIRRLMSLQLDFDAEELAFSAFGGAWAREMERREVPLKAGRFVSGSCTGASSNRSNPFCMIHPQGTGQDVGWAYGFNLIYSGNHYECAEVSPYGKVRLVSGINPQGFEWTLGEGGAFEAPEAVMSWSGSGFNGLSQNMHAFARRHIVRGKWRDRERPVLLNSWEAAYMDINEAKLLRLAKAAAGVGVELFVMDDGWFGERNSDRAGLGDWKPNRKKLPHGLKGLADKVKALGLDFGIWVEPEMCNVDSDFYRAHPDWTMDVPGRAHSEGRNQRVIDLANPEAAAAVTEAMKEVFSSADISYVKWDMNRPFTDVYSKYLPAGRQGETAHRYICALYGCLKELTEAFPEILFEGCSAGGNRFDLGMLCFFPQIWASDDTDAFERSEIQTGCSYGYPMSAVSAHVSASPNHQTLRRIPHATRFNVAAFGSFGYECDLTAMSEEELAEMKSEIALYKKWRSVFFGGSFYRGRTYGTAGALAACGGDVLEWTCVSPGGERAVGLFMQKLAVPNVRQQRFFAKGLIGEARYRFRNKAALLSGGTEAGKKGFMARLGIKKGEAKAQGAAEGQRQGVLSGIHFKKDAAGGAVEEIERTPQEREDFTAFGAAIMSGGVHLRPAFGGTGFREGVRKFSDFDSRLYFMEKIGRDEEAD